VKRLIGLVIPLALAACGQTPAPVVAPPAVPAPLSLAPPLIQPFGGRIDNIQIGARRFSLIMAPDRTAVLRRAGAEGPGRRGSWASVPGCAYEQGRIQFTTERGMRLCFAREGGRPLARGRA
jgi:hypothetical protein